MNWVNAETPNAPIDAKMKEHEDEPEHDPGDASRMRWITANTLDVAVGVAADIHVGTRVR
jgi:hypothetical protein